MGGNRWKEATALSQKATINCGSLVCQMGLFKVCQHVSSQTFMSLVDVYAEDLGCLCLSLTQCLIFLYKGGWRLQHTLWWIQCWDKTWPSGHQIQQLRCSMPEHGQHWRQAIDKFRCAELVTFCIIPLHRCSNHLFTPNLVDTVWEP